MRFGRIVNIFLTLGLGAFCVQKTLAIGVVQHCQIIFGEAHPRAWKESLNVPLMKQATQKFREHPSEIPQVDKRDPKEIKLAALDVLAERSGVQTPSSHFKDPSELSKKEIKKLDSLLKWLKFRKISSSDFESRLAKILTLLMKKDSKIEEYKKLGKPEQAIEDYVLKRTEEAIMKDGFAKMAKELGLPDKVIPRIIVKASNLSGTALRAVFTGASVLSAIHGDFVGIALPHWHMLNPSAKNIEPELWQRAIKNGAESVKDELKTRFKNKAAFDVWYNAFAKTVNRVIFVALIGVAVQNSKEEFDKQKKQALEEQEKIKAMQEQTAQLERFLEQFQTKYDWDNPEVALEQMWEDEVTEAIANGKKIIRDTQKYRDTRSHFIERGIWEDFSKATGAGSETFSPQARAELFEKNKAAYMQRYSQKYKIEESTWEKRKAEFLESFNSSN